MTEYRHNAHAVWDIKYHLVWITKYRYKILRGEVAERTRGYLHTMLGIRAVSVFAGQYRIVLNYPKAPYVEFSVVPATLEAKFHVSLQGTVS